MFGKYINFLETNMDLTSLKRNTISDNIANYNTPNYKATKVDESSMFDETLNGVLKTTKEKHIATNSMVNQPNLYKDEETKEREDGNNVDLTVEMMDMIQTQGTYNKAIQAFNYEMGLIKKSLGQ